MKADQFKGLFKYDRTKALFVGIERECFIANEHGEVVPKAHEILTNLNKGIEIPRCFGPDDLLKSRGDEFGYELSACQIETRVGPCSLAELRRALDYWNDILKRVLSIYGLYALCTEVGPEDMPLNVFPDPTGRYQRITKYMPRDILRAACRVIGTHVHVGMPDYETALLVYNYAIRHYAELCELGNGSFGERLAIYRQMAPDFEPKPYASWEEYYQIALEKGFSKDPRKCWTFIRISVHGTIEFRMFGATDSIDRIVSWATRCHQICQEAMLLA